MAIWNERIRNRRTEKGITLAQVADKLGVAEATAQRYESGSIKSVPYEQMCTYGEILGCSPAYLMGWEEESVKKINSKIREFNNSKEKKMITDLEFSLVQLNKAGLEKTSEYVSDLLDNNKYRKNSSFEQSDFLKVNAASTRTDVDIPEGADTSEDDIMDEDNF